MKPPKHPPKAPPAAPTASPPTAPGPAGYPSARAAAPIGEPQQPAYGYPTPDTEPPPQPHGYTGPDPEWAQPPTHGYGHQPYEPQDYGDADDGYDDEPESEPRSRRRRLRSREVHDLGALKQSRAGSIDQSFVHKLIHRGRNTANIELSLTAITVAAVLCKISISELSAQLASLAGGDAAARAFDVSIAVGVLGLAIATFQIPRQFAETLIYANQDALRVLELVGASSNFVVRCFGQLILRAMVRATAIGLVVSAVAYLVVAELLQLYVPVTRTYFLYDVGFALAVIVVFIVIVQMNVRSKVRRFFDDFRY